jgi:DNA polymerase-3 subunit epsilon
MSWLDNRALAFDLETTGLDPETARIVTAAVIARGGGNNPGFHDARTWLSDVDGAEIPTGASDIHKVTTAKAHADGDPAAEVVEDIATTLHHALAEGTPVVAMNARFDFTILDRECRRYGLPTLEQRLGREAGPVIDTYILDKQVDMFRRGSRKLEALALHYGVTLVDAHTADADARAAIEVAVAIAQRYRHLQVDAEQLHGWQVQWAAQQAVSLEEYKRRTDPTAVVERAWPVVPYKAPVADLLAALTTLAERYEEMAERAPKHPETLYIDPLTPAERAQHERGATYRSAAADIRDVLRTGRIPHGLMTDAELEQYGAKPADGAR